MDSLLVQDNALYVATELGLATYDTTLSPPVDQLTPIEGQLLEEPTGFTKVNPGTPLVIDISGFPSPDARIYGAGQSGFRVFNAEGQFRLAPQLVTASKSTGGRVYLLTAAYGFHPIETVPPLDPPRWVYACNRTDDASATFGGSIVLFDVGTAGTRKADPLTSVKELRRYVHEPPAHLAAKIGGLAAHNTVDDSTANVQALYVAYGPNHDATAQEQYAGLLVLKTHVIDPTPPPGQPLEYRIDFVDQIAAPPAPVCDGSPFKVTLDLDAPGHPRAYVALGCAGFAVYDLTNEWHPSVESYVPGGLPFQIQRGPATGGMHRLLVSYLNDGIKVWNDLTSLGTPSEVYPVPFQAIGLVPATTDLQRFWIAGGKSGVMRVFFDF